MPSFDDSQYRLIRNVLEKRWPNRKPIYPHNKFLPAPPKGLGIGRKKIRSLDDRLEKEFKAENLELTSFEIDKLLEADPMVVNLATLVYNRIRSVSESKEIKKWVISTIKSVHGPKVGSPTAATNLRTGGLGLKQGEIGDLAADIRATFFKLIRIKFSENDAKSGQNISDWVSVIAKQFDDQKRLTK